MARKRRKARKASSCPNGRDRRFKSRIRCRKAPRKRRKR